MRHAKSGDPVANVLCPTQDRQHVLNVRGFEKLEPAEFHERNVTARKLNFEARAVMRCPKENGLGLQNDSCFPSFEDLFDDVAGLCRVVRNIDEERPFRRRAVGPEVFGKALRGKLDDGIGCSKYRLRRSVITLQRYGFRLRTEMAGKIEDVAHGRRPKGIDRLRVIADNSQTTPGWLQGQ